ncbi:hypothetical protein G6F68_013289 [Rhizopus microsporus]|nr:hypothetical protein G6F69_009434 [Rhizopus microsporus]KAG1224725.1 hypothetical protein G6F67_009455 [Rhizopus microsporus]KAG1249510.1 hypothetical protein G6F68_013289 [Rhizopus microsporus]
MSLKSATGISSFFDIFEIARTPKLAFQYLEEQGAFFKSRKCAYGWSMTLAKRTNRSWFWRCNSRSCKFAVVFLKTLVARVGLYSKPSAIPWADGHHILCLRFANITIVCRA